jgi:hypothetical protein
MRPAPPPLAPLALCRAPPFSPALQNRGWTAVINDDLVSMALGLSNIMVASISVRDRQRQRRWGREGSAARAVCEAAPFPFWRPRFTTGHSPALVPSFPALPRPPSQTAVGAGFTYVAMAGNPNRGLIAALAAVFAFVCGFAMSAVMNAVLVSAVRTVFVCFALNPAALAAAHPGHLATLAGAWAEFHPTVWSTCGYAVAYPSAIVVQTKV